VPEVSLFPKYVHLYQYLLLLKTKQ